MGNALITRRGGTGGLDYVEANDCSVQSPEDVATDYLAAGASVTVDLDISGNFASFSESNLEVAWAALSYHDGFTTRVPFLAFPDRKHRTVFNNSLDIETEIVTHGGGRIYVRATFTNISGTGMYVPEAGERVECIAAVRRIEVGE